MIVRANRTSVACPSQWDAWTETGERLHLRFRHGRGTVYNQQIMITHFSHGSETDGYLDIEEFCRLAGLELSPGVS